MAPLVDVSERSVVRCYKGCEMKRVDKEKLQILPYIRMGLEWQYKFNSLKNGRA
jgi:hypothetical protein